MVAGEGVEVAPELEEGSMSFMAIDCDYVVCSINMG